LANHSGRKDARRDLAAGILAQERYGLPALGLNEDHSQIVLTPEEYAQFLSERYGVQLRTVAGCIAGERVRGHAEGYNEVMDAEIERRYGTNFWHQSRENAMKFYEEKKAHPETHS
jgi:hypothetical protein